ncbi:MAG: lycopene cyclase [Actinobacteria bacterium]|nr:lycopene cyclase [Actinomycetota bacterium]
MCPVGEPEFDVAVLGAGGAGLSVVVALDRLARRRRAAGEDVTVPSVVLVDPVVRAGADRTWCFWDVPDGEVLAAVEGAVHRQWRRVEVVGPDGEVGVHDLNPLRYVMVRSADFYALADKALVSLGVERVVAAVDEVVDGARAGAGSQVRTTDGRTVSARWVLDSRPAAPRRPANTAWLQHFRGWTLAFDPATLRPGALDPQVPVLMDFTTPQPHHAVSFGYVLPLDDRRALVEYTEFSRTRLTGEQYDTALRGYLEARFGAAAAAAAVVEEVEDGAIPMSDAVLDARPAPGRFRVGTAGGATRPSTGYTFAAMQRQAHAIAEALLDGRPPAPPAAYSHRHLWMDAVLLRALDTGRTGGAALLATLFARNRPADVLRFLDSGTTLVEDLTLMRTTPVLAMSAAAFGDTAARLRRRLTRRT